MLSHRPKPEKGKDGKHIELSESNVRILKLQRRSTVYVTLFVVVMFGGMGALGILANGGRLAAEDSSNSTSAQLQGQERSACLSDRRSDQANAQAKVGRAQGAELRAALLALNASAAKDKQGFHDQIVAGIIAIAQQDKAEKEELATERQLEPKVLNQEPPVGCGPPITSRSQLTKGGG